MEEHALYLLIIRHLEGNTSTDEDSWIENWLKESPDHAYLYDQFRHIWEAGKPVNSHADTQVALQQVKLKLGMDCPETATAGKRFHLLRSWPYVAAASLLLLIAVGSLLFKHTVNAIAYTVIRNGVSEKKKLRLPDGTVVHLAQESHLRYPEKFDGDHRDIYLEGEAFFEVNENPHHPFVVHSGRFETQVLGTTFNISAFPQQQRLSVSLLSGKVAIKDMESKKQYILLPGKELSVMQHHPVIISNFDEGVVTGWINDKLVFRNEPLGLAAERIALMYGIKIVFKDKSLMNDPLWGTFQQESLSYVLEAIKLAGNIDYVISDKTVYLQKKLSPL